MTKRTKTSKGWMREHVTDAFVRAAKREGYRSRAAYKLLEIDKRDSIFRPGMLVVDLGAAPGGWSQIVKERVGSRGRVFAVDLLPMASIPGVNFIQVDFSTDAGLAQLQDSTAGCQIDVVISDMAPNISGISVSDQARSIALAELAFEFATQNLKPGGSFLVKLFQGDGFDSFVVAARLHFKRVIIRKPEASRDRSREVYLLGTGKRT